MKTFLLKDKEVIIDDEDYEKVIQHSWWLHKDSKSKNYFTIKGHIEGRSTYLHRFILNLSAKDKVVVDHINRNTLDNRKVNLRITTQTLNRLNSAKRSNKTGYIGVTKEKNYLATLCKEKLGFFATAELAALYRDKVLLSKYGENVEFNFDLETIHKSEWPQKLKRGDSLRNKEFKEKRLYDRPDKESLHRLIWSQSIASLALEFKCSGNTIRKWCKNYKIPTPSMGFWAKLYAGKMEGQFCPLQLN